MRWKKGAKRKHLSTSLRCKKRGLLLSSYWRIIQHNGAHAYERISTTPRRCCRSQNSRMGPSASPIVALIANATHERHRREENSSHTPSTPKTPPPNPPPKSHWTKPPPDRQAKTGKPCSGFSRAPNELALCNGWCKEWNRREQSTLPRKRFDIFLLSFAVTKNPTTPRQVGSGRPDRSTVRR